MGQSDRVSQILKKESQRLSSQNRVLEEAICHRPSEKSVWSTAGWVWFAKAGGSGPSVDWIALGKVDCFRPIANILSLSLSLSLYIYIYVCIYMYIIVKIK